jgi:hypothetical protein
MTSGSEFMEGSKPRCGEQLDRKDSTNKETRQTDTVTTINKLLLAPLQTSRMCQLTVCIVSIPGKSTAVQMFKKIPSLSIQGAG